MAPGRRRGAKGDRTKRELSLGDLVLAKVKGFPPWPAKICKPEDWKKIPDPKKHFVVFFGTLEIAFVAPADIQEFTDEVKKKLCERGKGKSGKTFEQAVKQICEEFEKLQPGRDTIFSQTLASEGDCIEQVIDQAADVTENNGEEISPNSSNSFRKNEDSDVKTGSESSESGSSEDDQDGLLNCHKSATDKGRAKKNKGSVHRNKSSRVDDAGKALRRKGSSGDDLKSKSADVSKSGEDVGTERSDKKLVGRKGHIQREDDGLESANEEHKKVMSRKKMNAKLHKSVDIGGRAGRAKAPSVPGNKVTNTEPKKLTAVSEPLVGVERNAHDSKDSINEDDLPPAKRHRRALEATPSSDVNDVAKSVSSATYPTDSSVPNNVQSPLLQLPKKRRAVRLCDMEDDELPKTPVHGGSTSKFLPQLSDTKNKNYEHTQLGFRNSGTRDQVHSGGLSNSKVTLAAQHNTEKRPKESSVARLQFDKLSSDVKPVISTKGSNKSLVVPKQAEEPKAKQSNQTLGHVSENKDPGMDIKIHTTIEPNQSRSGMNKPASSSDRVSSHGERKVPAKDSKATFPVVSQISDSVMSMKHLIAAAQARKRQAHLHNSFGNHLLLTMDTDLSGRSPSPLPTAQALESGDVLQSDKQVSLPTFLDSDAHQNSSANQNESEELYDRKNSGNQGTGSSLSGNTEAAVARDAFEGMIETLSRTKESIGRATRQAIDCSKYGIANEIVELLIKKLENEQSFHRKVDLFFLVDSITQCSHSQRGIAGASYIPVVKAVLPRLIAAAAPAGAGAQENRRQCLKVLRLWLERKILPESVLRSCIDDIGPARDDTSAGHALRRPSRSERAIDDPIREMEGIVVDEYGSNATFELPGLLSGHSFVEEEYEENLSADLGTDIDARRSKDSPATSRGTENHDFTPSDRRHFVLEDVDGELEMEDVSGGHKDDKLPSSSPSQPVSFKPNSDAILGYASSFSSDFQYSPHGPPPLPSGSPPPTPPLPTSPPPSLSFSPPSRSLPTSTPPIEPNLVSLQPTAPDLQSVPPVAHPPPPVAPFPVNPPPPVVPPPPPGGSPMLPAAPPPPPPPLPFEPPPQPPLGPNALRPFGHPPFGSLQTSVAPPPPPAGPQLAMAPTVQVHPLQSFSGHPQMLSQPPRLQSEIVAVPFVNQQTNDSSSRSEVSSQQPSNVHLSGISNPLDTGGYPLHPHGDAFMNPQIPQQGQHFLPGAVSFAQGPVRPEVRPQHALGHFPYHGSSQKSQHQSYPTNFSDGQMRYGTEEARWMHTNQYADCSHNGWTPGGPHSGYYGSTPDRPPGNPVNFQPSAPNTLPSGGQIPVRGGSMMPHRPDTSSMNWRPA